MAFADFPADAQGERGVSVSHRQNSFPLKIIDYSLTNND
jgi:hypothetical protein